MTSYTVTGHATLDGVPLTCTSTLTVQPPAQTTPKKIIGMSAPATNWSTRLAEVGPAGVKARRIFALLNSAASDQTDLIGQAVSAGLLPVCSWKVPDLPTYLAGGYDAWLDTLNGYLGGLGVTVAAAFHHEPQGDMTGAQFCAGSQRFLDHVTAPNVKVGPILNGWLLDNQVSTFASFTSPALLAQWDFVAVDTYQAGTVTAPDAVKYGGRAVPLLASWLDGQGFPNMPIGVGEYNGFTADSLTKGGEAILSCPELWFGLVWNSEGGLGHVLTADRLAAYQATKADARAQQ